jgi:C4-dicarboxylate-specific signal transduction histidine kinase
VLNLLQNAMEAVSGKPAGARHIHVDCDEIDGRTVELSIRDSGPGLPDDTTAMFEPFYTTKPKGMGLGLPIVRTIVEAHGGSIIASNVAGGGARFDIVLPTLAVQES